MFPLFSGGFGKENVTVKNVPKVVGIRYGRKMSEPEIVKELAKTIIRNK